MCRDVRHVPRTRREGRGSSGQRRPSVPGHSAGPDDPVHEGPSCPAVSADERVDRLELGMTERREDDVSCSMREEATDSPRSSKGAKRRFPDASVASNLVAATVASSARGSLLPVSWVVTFDRSAIFAESRSRSVQAADCGRGLRGARGKPREGSRRKPSARTPWNTFMARSVPEGANRGWFSHFSILHGARRERYWQTYRLF